VNSLPQAIQTNDNYKMTHIESQPAHVNAPAAQVFTFLSDMKNIEKLLPAGKYSEWKAEQDMCSFKIQNAYTIGLRIKESKSNEEITYESTAGSPFPFTLKVQLKEAGAQTTGQLICDAQINPFLEMMVKTPLKNLFDYMAGQLPSAMGL
jgi:carbon monoxide dehydrogenase subunit G